VGYLTRGTGPRQTVGKHEPLSTIPSFPSQIIASACGLGMSAGKNPGCLTLEIRKLGRWKPLGIVYGESVFHRLTGESKRYRCMGCHHGRAVFASSQVRSACKPLPGANSPYSSRARAHLPLTLPHFPSLPLDFLQGRSDNPTLRLSQGSNLLSPVNIAGVKVANKSALASHRAGIFSKANRRYSFGPARKQIFRCSSAQAYKHH
jgi:hypothetical protein